MSDNWVVQNLENALETWNEKLAEIWQLITQSPEQFKGGTIWNVIVGIHGAVQAIGLALLVLFFVVGVMKTCGSFAELKRSEHALKVFIRFVLAKAAVTYGKMCIRDRCRPHSRPGKQAAERTALPGMWRTFLLSEHAGQARRLSLRLRFLRIRFARQASKGGGSEQT